MLTVSRLVAVFILLALFDYDYGTTAGRATFFLVFVGAALTDLVDGTLAKKLAAESALGAFIDPLADKALCWVSLWIIWQLCDIAPVARILLVPVYLAIGGYDLVTTGLRYLKSRGFKLEMRTSHLGKVRTANIFVTLGAVFFVEALRSSMSPLLECVATVAFCGAGVWIVYLTYQSGRQYLLTARPWEVLWPSSASAA